ncbi:MAG: 30S ribosomal protein S7 [Candidatus Thermoplasmatota archaeon]|jgi:small subunit ribosomal protein S7|nr:30S ribosomal protein S7 [Candidatus Thermoplasmatota archaeon]MDA8142653.1 30S ribosomal protein S7 [Thermoplasmatales archaeon]
MVDLKILGEYAVNEVQVHDEGLSKYINLTSNVNLHSGGRFSSYSAGKRNVNTVERLLNKLMRTEKWTGKKYSAYRVLREAFELVTAKTKQNPVQILVNAIENAAPREEVTRLKYGGIAVPKAVDVSPSRRVDVALRNIAIGATNASYKSKKPISNCLADEIMNAARNDASSFAVSKKEEMERIAASAR